MKIKEGNIAELSNTNLTEAEISDAISDLSTIDWTYIPDFISEPEADRLYDSMDSFPWLLESEGKYAVHYGKSYGAQGNQRVEHPIPPLLDALAERIAAVAQKRANYIQCHRMDETAVVRPHRDPAGMIVPMLTLGQTRTFRVGGTMPQGLYRMRQSQRKVHEHIPDEEIVMGHGDLLIFTGGQVVHSMAAAKDDPKFNPGKFEWRYSLLFRWATDAMRQHGPGEKARKAGHDTQYKNEGNL